MQLLDVDIRRSYDHRWRSLAFRRGTELTAQQWRTQAQRHLGAAELVGTLDLLAHAVTSSDGDRTDDVAELIGRPTTAFRQWVRDHAAEFE